MGLKIGLVTNAEREGKFISLSKKDGHPYSLAQSFRRGGQFFLLYPDGKIGSLQLGYNHQLQLFFISFPEEGFMQTELQRQAIEGTLPSSQIIFDGGYTPIELYDDFLPPDPIHVTDEERFRNPRGEWEKVVAMYLNREPPSVCV